ncbi:MAG: hypothetical protein WC932_03205 [archaeon]|jgi:hypothetical protein
MGLSKIYYYLENKYYDFVEKTGLYKITDKIDKFMPSFLFFILLIIMIIAGIFLALPAFKGGNDVSITFRVMDDLGDPVPLAPVSVATIDNTYNFRTNEDGVTENVIIPKDSEYTVDIDFAGSDYEIYGDSFIAEEDTEQSIFLETISTVTQTRYTFSLIDSETRRQINKNGTAEFLCINPGATAPGPVNVKNGVVEVTADSACQLRVKSIIIPGYQTRYDGSITQSTLNLDLIAEVNNFEGAYPVYITVLGDGQSLSGVTASLHQNGVAILGKNCVTVTGVCSITGVETGNYTLRVTDTRSNAEYGSTEMPFPVTGTTSQTVILTRSIAGYILVKVKKANGQAIEGVYLKLKEGDAEISSGFLTDANGFATVPVYNLNKIYRIVAEKEGYMIGAQNNIIAIATVPTTPQATITLQLVTPLTAATLNVRVVNSETGKGFSHAQVVLYDSETGFLTDYDSKITDFNGNCTFRVSNGNYYAKAFRGASIGSSEDFVFDVRNAVDFETIQIPIVVVKGTLNISVVDKDGEPVPRANIILFDKYSSRTSVYGGDLANVDGTYEIIDLVSDTEVYAVVSDITSNLGITQSEYVYIKPNQSNELKVTLYPKVNALQKPQIEFLGFFNDTGNRINKDLRAGGEYKAKFLLLIPQDRDSDEEFQELGAIVRTGSKSSVATPYFENDSIFIKSIELPNAVVTRYTQYSSEEGYDNVDDVDTITEGDSKWFKVVFDEIYGKNYANAYTVTADIKVKDEAVYGEEVSISYLGFGYNEDDEYENDPVDQTNNDLVEYMTYKTENFNIGEEQACSDDFCFSLNITNLDEDLREDVVSEYTATPQQNYKLKFGLINNNKDRIYSNSRLEIKNLDKGLTFKNMIITQPNGDTTTLSVNDNNSEYKVVVSQFNPHTTVSGEMQFVPILKGDRQFVLTFISDQRVIFTKLIVIHVLSDKTFTVKITPEVVPSGKNFNLQVEVKDTTSGIEVEGPVTVRVKDRFKRDLLASPVKVGTLGIASVNNVPGQESGNKVYVYVEAPEYETSITEIEVTENIFKITPIRLGVSLNVNTKTTENAKFTIENLSESELIIQSITFVGDDDQIDVIDVERVNASLAGYNEISIPGIDSSGDASADNYNNKQEIEARFFTSPRAESIKQLRNVPAKLVIRLRDRYNREYVWDAELPATLTVGFEGLMDNANCIGLSEIMWETTIVDYYADTQFNLKNNCAVGERPVPLNGGLSAKVEFEGNPLGVFTVNVGNRLVELSNGYYKNIYDTVDQEKLYNVNLKYTPVGRYTGDIKGKIIFRSVNATSAGNQEILSEYKFILHVVSLKDCYTISKKVLTAPETGTPDTFTIENKGCGSETVYRLSCDDCTGLVISPKESITVPATGSSEEIKVMSMGAMPGIYLVNVYSKVSGARGSERNVGKIRVEVRPVTQCLDLDRYEFDLYRYQYSENTGNEVTAKSFDTVNLINRCYGQTVKVEGSISSAARWKMAIFSGLRDGVFTGLATWGAQSMGDWMKSLFGLAKNLFTPAEVKDIAKSSGKSEKVAEAALEKAMKETTLSLALKSLEQDGLADSPSQELLKKKWCEQKGNEGKDGCPGYQAVAAVKPEAEKTDCNPACKSTENCISGKCEKGTLVGCPCLEGYDCVNGVCIANSSTDGAEKTIKELNLVIISLSATLESEIVRYNHPCTPLITAKNYLDGAKRYASMEFPDKKSIELNLADARKFMDSAATICVISVAEPSATEPSATEPSATEPSATEPSATEPPATEPPATEPPATEPPATEPTVSEQRIQEAISATTGAICDKNKKVGTTAENLFNVRPSGESQVYVCTDKTHYRYCYFGTDSSYPKNKWSAILSTTGTGHTILINACNQLN